MFLWKDLKSCGFTQVRRLIPKGNAVYPICHGIQPHKYRDTETEMAFTASCFSVSRLGWVLQPQNQGIHNQVYRSYLQEIPLLMDGVDGK